MPLDATISNFVAGIDGIFLDAVPGVVAAAIGAVRDPLRLALSLYVIVHGVFFILGDLSARTLGVVTMRAMCVVAILQAPNYTTYIQNAFLTDIPGQIASALNGGRIDANAARQFDVLREGLANLRAAIIMRSPGFNGMGERIFAHVLDAAGVIGIGGMAFYWYAPRILIGVAVVLGPFLIPLWLFEATRAFAAGFFAKLVSFVAMQVSGSALVLVLIKTIDRIGAVAAAPGVAGATEMLVRLLGCALLMWFGAFLMKIVPPAFSFAPSLGAASNALIAAGTAAVMAPARMALRAAR